MSDDLVRRLQSGSNTKRGADDLIMEAADRIEALEAAILAADEAISAMNFTVALAHHLDQGEGSTIILMDEILSAQNMALAAYRQARDATR